MLAWVKVALTLASWLPDASKTMSCFCFSVRSTLAATKYQVLLAITDAVSRYTDVVSRV